MKTKADDGINNVKLGIIKFLTFFYKLQRRQTLIFTVKRHFIQKNYPIRICLLYYKKAIQMTKNWKWLLFHTLYKKTARTLFSQLHDRKIAINHSYKFPETEMRSIWYFSQFNFFYRCFITFSRTFLDVDKKFMLYNGVATIYLSLNSIITIYLT